VKKFTQSYIATKEWIGASAGKTPKEGWIEVSLKNE
jgi:hypothetical protein